MTLYQEMLNLFSSHRNEWNYYGQAITNPFEEFLVSDFIREFFDYGGKGMVITNLYNEMEPMRHSHTMSAYFLGILIKEQLCPDLEVIGREEDYNYEFSYMWFIVCLFHDMGYAQEKDWKYKFKYRHDTKQYIREFSAAYPKRFPRRYEYEDLGVLFCAPQIFYDKSYKYRNIGTQTINGIMFNNGITVHRSRYSKNTIFNYLEYCKMHEDIGHYDHGIVGGLWLYDSLIKNYYKHYMNELNIRKYIDVEEFINQEGLLFSKKQWKIFAYLADCIISHNMWAANSETNEFYLECELDQLSLGKFEIISFYENPILYLLAIADTLEPIKIYSQVGLTDIEILNGIIVVITGESITMKITDSRMPFERLANKVKGIESWLDARADIDYIENSVNVYFSLRY